MQDKYILQYGSLAGWPYKVAKTLRNKGIVSKNIVFFDKDVADLSRQLPFDEALCKASDTIFEKMLAIFRFIQRVPKECQLVHYHSSNIFYRELHWLYEGPKFRKANIPMLISFGGGDARIVKDANAKNPHFYRENNAFRDFIIKSRYFSWTKNIRFCATDPEMAEYARPYFDEVFTFRQPVDLQEVTCKYPKKDNSLPVVLHIPTEPWVKGTEEIEVAVDNLKRKGLKFTFKKIRQLSQQEVYRELAECDIYVDELRCGSHGVTAVESMASGKPTITYIRDDLVEKFPKELPLVNANINNIESVLADLIQSASLRHDIGRRSRAYVEKYHDASVVADDLIKIYEAIGYAQ